MYFSLGLRVEHVLVSPGFNQKLKAFYSTDRMLGAYI
jgi:hypothetical protein